jgi:hypothetical protein
MKPLENQTALDNVTVGDIPVVDGDVGLRSSIGSGFRSKGRVPKIPAASDAERFLRLSNAVGK